jgi:ubiquinone/menaquinone biosynthesis C-methylase UbiE
VQKNIKNEENFHDSWASIICIENVMVDEFFEACTSPENKIILKYLGSISGKKILELGCGAGEASVYFAKKGAMVTATDLSSGMIDVVKKVAKKHKTNLCAYQCNSNKLPFNNQSFDIVYAANLLHHVDIDSTIKEIARVLKDGGTFVSWDPLAHNPLINIYRRIASEVRTEDEHPLKMCQLRLFKKYYSDVSFETTWLFTLWIFIKFYLIDRINPNKERYWKKILTDHNKLEAIYYRLERLDKLLLKLFPFLKRYCWNIVICAKK